MSHSTCFLQRPLFLIALFLIDLGQVSHAMRPYPAYPPPAAATAAAGTQPQHMYNHNQRHSDATAFEATSWSQHETDSTQGLYRQKAEQMMDPAQNKVIPHYDSNCGGSALSSLRTDCARSPAPEEAAGSEIDPRYGVEKRLVPTGPNPLHN